ncbi:MAG: hypothetical protein QUS07_07215 [Methanothrix sp.]|nr:hypothetical protein [Methanothrix sp.]
MTYTSVADAMTAAENTRDDLRIHLENSVVNLLAILKSPETDQTLTSLVEAGTRFSDGLNEYVRVKNLLEVLNQIQPGISTVPREQFEALESLVDRLEGQLEDLPDDQEFERALDRLNDAIETIRTPAGFSEEIQRGFDEAHRQITQIRHLLGEEVS